MVGQFTAQRRSGRQRGGGYQRRRGPSGAADFRQFLFCTGHHEGATFGRGTANISGDFNFAVYIVNGSNDSNSWRPLPSTGSGRRDRADRHNPDHGGRI